MPKVAKASRMTPRACATGITVLAFLKKKIASTPHSSGLNSSIKLIKSSRIIFKRLAGAMVFGVDITPDDIYLKLSPATQSTIPKPTVAVPGSMPMIRLGTLFALSSRVFNKYNLN
jgi:hypothetical protein